MGAPIPTPVATIIMVLTRQNNYIEQNPCAGGVPWIQRLASWTGRYGVGAPGARGIGMPVTEFVRGTSASGNWCRAVQQARIRLLSFRKHNMRRVLRGLV